MTATLRKAAEALRDEWSGIDKFVSKILVPDQTNPDGDKVIDAYRVSSGAWLMLQARIRHVIEAINPTISGETTVEEFRRSKAAIEAELTRPTGQGGYPSAEEGKTP